MASGHSPLMVVWYLGLQVWQQWRLWFWQRELSRRPAVIRPLRWGRGFHAVVEWEFWHVDWQNINEYQWIKYKDFEGRSLQDFYVTTVSFDCLSHMDPWQDVKLIRTDSHSLRARWKMWKVDTKRDQQIWFAQSWHHITETAWSAAKAKTVRFVFSSFVFPICRRDVVFEKRNDVPILFK